MALVALGLDLHLRQLHAFVVELAVLPQLAAFAWHGAVEQLVANYCASELEPLSKLVDWEEPSQHTVADKHAHMRETAVRLTCASDKLHLNAAQMAGDEASVVHHDQVQMFSKLVLECMALLWVEMRHYV